jgi:hypothetical protein
LLGFPSRGEQRPRVSFLVSSSHSRPQSPARVSPHCERPICWSSHFVSFGHFIPPRLGACSSNRSIRSIACLHSAAKGARSEFCDLGAWQRLLIFVIFVLQWIHCRVYSGLEFLHSSLRVPRKDCSSVVSFQLLFPSNFILSLSLCQSGMFQLRLPWILHPWLCSSSIGC